VTARGSLSALCARLSFTARSLAARSLAARSLAALSLAALSLAIASSFCASACSGRQASPGGVPELSEHPLRGAPAPAFDLPIVHGSFTSPRATLAAYSGRVLLLDFWATWCEPCKRSFPHYEAFSRRYGERVAVLAVSEDDEADGIDLFAAETGVGFPLAWDAGKSMARSYRLKGMPTLFIVDASGIVRFVKAGYLAGDELDIEKALASLLEPSSRPSPP
jgi:thiol-disulfide isomerase/thioredoxin